MRKIVLYIVYGDDQNYYDGAKFSLLTFMHWLNASSQIEFVFLTERPDEFEGYPVTIFPISKEQKNKWSIGNAYHFRIKNRGIAYIIDQMNLKQDDKILFFDTDTYFHNSPIPLFDLIKPSQALLYLNEGLISSRKKFLPYLKNLIGMKIEIDGVIYELSKKSSMWGSAIIGIMPNMRTSLEWADQLMIKLLEIVPSHTIEQFALSESLLKKYSIKEGKKFVSLYSTKRKKQNANRVLTAFFETNKSLAIDEQVNLAQLVKIKRPILIILQQRLLHLFNK